jgi:acyl-CoA synthetase (AMP-forming)/AMP-acid ligase II/thioesterase domain-containing protein/acyl carrier protein
MLPWLSTLGCIEDVALNIRWDPVAFSQEVARRAAFLSRMKVRRGSIVAIMREGGAYFLADLFAAWSLGAAAACLDSTLTDEELRLIIRVARPEILLTDRTKVPDIGSVPVFDLTGFPGSKVSIPTVAVAAEDRAIVLFTSGTTGQPKGVILSFQALWARVRANIAAIGRERLSRTLVTLPLHFGHGLIGNTLTPLLAGGDIVLHPPGLPLAQNLGSLVDAHRITFMSSVPALWRAATRGNPPIGTSLTRVHVGSAPLPVKLWSEIAAWSRAEVINCYGLTEAANWIAGASSRDGIAEGLLGKPWGCTVAVLNDDKTIRAAGGGEILVKSPAVMSGYLDRPDLTAAVLMDGWLRTGDRGRVDEHGRIWFSGRIKEQINRAGFKIQPVELDALLERHPAVAEACVFGIPDSMSGEAVAAAVRLSEGATATAGILQSWCLEYSRREAVPERWFFVDAIPRTANGKVSRDAVRRKLLRSDLETSAEPSQIAAAASVASPATGAEGAMPGVPDNCVRSAVECAWSAVLGNAAVAQNLSWEAAGGDSINTLRLWLHLEEALGVRLPLDIIRPDASLDDVTTAVETAIGSQSLGLMPCSSDRRPVVFFLPPAEGDLPILAQFRAAFADRIRFVLIQYPPWHKMIRSGGSFESIVDDACAQIRARSCDGNYFLAGYSFGGFVAYEVAHRLVESGDRIGFLGLIDTRHGGPSTREESLTKTVRSLGRIIVRPQDKLKALPKRLIAALSSIRAFRSLIVVGRLANMLPPRLAFELNWHLTTHVRMKALRRWTVQPHDVSAILFRAADEWQPSDNGWGQMCRQLSVVAVEGSHLSMFSSPNLEVLCAKFLEVLAASSGTFLV